MTVLSLLQALPRSPPSPGLVTQLVTAGTAACLADIATFPLDTVKVSSSRLLVHSV